MKRITIVCAALFLFGAAGVSQAARGLVQSTTMPVTTTIIPAVTVTASLLDFGTVISGESSDTDATINVTATANLAYSIGLNGGVNPYLGGRALKSPMGDFIAYSVYQDVDHTKPWGDGGATIGSPGDMVTGVGNGGAQQYFVYGHMETSQTHPPEVYTDTLIVTVLY